MSSRYPEFFFSFSGSTKESVKAIGHDNSGWMSGELIRTRLLDNLDSLSSRILSGAVNRPVSVYLVGGPGNGKTEAAAYFLKKLYCGDLPVFSAWSGHKQFNKRVAPGIDGVVVVEDATELSKDVLKSEMLEFALRANRESPRRNYIYIHIYI